MHGVRSVTVYPLEVKTIEFLVFPRNMGTEG